MKKYAPYIIIAIALLLLGQFLTSLIRKEEEQPQQQNADAEEERIGYIDVYLFYGDGCPHCADEEEFLGKYIKNDPEKIELHTFEVWNNSENQNILQKVGDELNVEIAGVPFTVIGDEYISGYASDNTTGKEITTLIDKCYKNECPDPVYKIAYGKDKPAKEKTEGNENKEDGNTEDDLSNKDQIELPFGYSVNAKKYSLPFLTIVIAFFDGFNPCAMWVLLYLISMLLGMKNKKKMWVLGITFIAASALVYFVFLAAWLSVFQIINFISAIRIIIGLVAVGSGTYHINKYFKTKNDGCEVVDAKKRKKIFSKIKNITGNKKFIAAMVGIIALAFSVNLIELVCSAGLPAIYTNILSAYNFTPWKYYAYLFLYTLIFMLDDIAIFAIAMLSLKAVGISKKYEKISSIVGGILIFIIGILLIFKPEWLMWG